MEVPNSHRIQNTTNAINRVKIRVGDIKSNLIDKFLNMSIDEYNSIINKHNNIINKICENSKKYYNIFNNRLHKNGNMASFPEYEGVIYYLLKAIFKTDIYATITQNYNIHLELIIHKLLTIMCRENKYQYAPTILIISDMIELIDICIRHKTDTNNPYYHTFRYKYYLYDIIFNNNYNNIIIPTCSELNLTEFINIRSYPIYFVGVLDSTLYADGYKNTPLEFFYHDIQHTRRFIQETQTYYDRYVKHRTYYHNRKPDSIVSIEQFYDESYTFKNKLMKYINAIINEDEKKCIILLVFEIVHEKAWVLTRNSLIRCIILYHDIFPIENYSYDSNTNDVNLKSVYFKDPTTLSNIKHKLLYGFYDNIHNSNNKSLKLILTKEKRNTKFIAQCAYNLLVYLDNHKFDNTDTNKNKYLKLLQKLTKDTTGTDEYKGVKTINPNNNISNIDNIDNNDINLLFDNDRYNPYTSFKSFDFLNTSNNTEYKNIMKAINYKKTKKVNN